MKCIRPNRKGFLLRSVVLLSSLMSGLLLAQTPTGTIVGTVTDQSGAVVPNGGVTVSNLGTSRAISVKTNESGHYVVPLLNPGNYSVAVEHAGFRKEIRNGIILQVDQRAQVDFVLRPGEVTEVIEVTGEAPLLEIGTSSLGQVIENRRIVGLPLNARGVFNLVALVPGVIPNQDQFFTLQADSSINPSLFKANGGRTLTNEVLVDGVPNNGGSFGQIALHPTVDAVQEFKVQTNNYSAEFGNSGGAVVNVNIKSGTNHLHGTLWEFLRNDILDANDFFANRAGRHKGKFRFNQFGGTAGGPVFLPKVYDGQNKSFFFLSYEGVRRITGREPTFLTLPTPEQRKGDFSSLRDINGNLIPIFDPLTTSLDTTTGRFVRSAFPNNLIPAGRISPVAQRLLGLVPSPNSTPSNLFTQANNFISQDPDRVDINQFNLKTDHSFSSSNTVTFRYSRNRSNNRRPDFFGNAATPNFGPLTFLAQNALVQDVHTFNPTTILTLRVGLSRFTTDRQHFGGGNVDIQGLGLPSSIPGTTFPQFDISGYSSIGTPLGNFIRRAVNIYSIQPSLSKVKGNHDIKIGGDYRIQQQNTFQPRAISGGFSFGRNFTQGPTLGQAGSGDGFAAFLLGFPEFSELSIEAAVAESRPYYALYIQDNFRVTPKLTVNLGLRYDLHGPRTDRFDRLLNFDRTATNPVTGTPGAFLFVGQNTDTRHQFDRDTNNLAPRFGLSYQLTKETVVRGGVSVNYISAFNEGDTNSGLGLSPTFSTRGINNQGNSTVPEVSISNPFPQGLNLPTGAQPGLAALVGESGTFFDRNYPIPFTYNWNFGIQHELQPGFVVEVAYAGSKGNKLNGPSFNLNTLRPEFLSLGDGLRQQVPNPFFGKISSGILSGPTVERQLLLRDFPQFTNVTQLSPHDYFSNYHALELRVERRFTAGFSLLASYTASKLIDNAAGPAEAGGAAQNVFDRAADKSLSGEDIPQRLVVSSIYELPFGAGKRFHTTGPGSKILGGWLITGISTFSKERPLAPSATGGSFVPGSRRPNLVGNPTLPSGQRSIQRWFNTDAFAFPATAFTLGNGPRTLPSTRQPGFQIWDLAVQKDTLFKERYTIQFRLEMFNAFNKTNFRGPGTTLGAANFGQISSARPARQIQFGLKFIY